MNVAYIKKNSTMRCPRHVATRSLSRRSQSVTSTLRIDLHCNTSRIDRGCPRTLCDQSVCVFNSVRIDKQTTTLSGITVQKIHCNSKK
jgi:hypothetical protein